MPHSLLVPFRPAIHQPFGRSYLAIALLLVLVLLPLALIAGQSVILGSGFSLSRYGELLQDQRALGLLAKSTAIAGGATVLALLIGVPLATCLGRERRPGRKVLIGCCLVPLFMPPHIQALAWLTLVGDQGRLQRLVTDFLGLALPPIPLYSPQAAAFFLALAYAPLAAIVVMTGLSQIDRGAEEAAALHKRAVPVWLKIILPLLRPYLLSGAIFVFLLSFFNYGIPSMLRVMTFPVEILTRFSALYDHAGAVARALPVVLLCFALLLLHKKLLADKAVVAIHGPSQHRQPRTLPAGPAAPLVVWAYLLVAVVLPLIALVLQAGSIKTILVAIATSWQALITSLLLAVAAATLSVTLAYFLARALESGIPGSKALDLLTLAPLAVPGPLLAIGLIQLWNRPAGQFVYASSAILILAYLARFLPFAVRIVAANLQQLNPSLREAAVLFQAGGLRRLLVIDLPLVKEGLLISWLVVFLFSMGELAATLLLIPPGRGTLALKIYTLMHYGAGPLVAALSLLLIGASLAVCLAALLVINKKPISRASSQP